MNEPMTCTLLDFKATPCIAVVSVVGVIIISLTIMVIVLSYWVYKIKKKVSKFQLYLKEKNSVELIDRKNVNQSVNFDFQNLDHDCLSVLCDCLSVLCDCPDVDCDCPDVDCDCPGVDCDCSGVDCNC